VACVDGRAYLVHGWIDEAGQYVSVVDVAHGAFVREGHVPEGAGMWDSAAGLIWTTAIDATGTKLVAVTPSTLATRVVASPGLPNDVLACGDSVYVLGGGARVAGGPALAFVEQREAGTGDVVRSATPAGLAHGAVRGAAAGEVLGVIDWTGDDPESRSIVLLAREGLRPLSTLGIDGVPCALAGWERTLVAVDRRGGRLLLIDSDTRRVRSSIDLGTGELIHADVEVVPACGDL
jgi:hypothetical protein